MKFPDCYPMATKLYNGMEFAKGILDASGVTVHHTGDTGVDRTMRSLREVGLGYHIVIDREGGVHQLTFLSQRVNHAGEANWNGKSPNRHHLAVAVESWGAVTLKDKKFKAWTGLEIPATEVARRPGNLGPSDFHWHAATKRQEMALIGFLRWCVSKGIKPTEICGHDECALPKGRKSDPGGTLSMTMREVRNVVQTKPGS